LVIFSQLEARIASQERLTHALGKDVAASFRQLADYQITAERNIEARFDRIDVQLQAHEALFDRIDAQLQALEGRIQSMEDQMQRMEGRIQYEMHQLEDRVLSAFQQMLELLEARLPGKGDSSL
jgi:uncharacterized coiled-coil protein SlyX